MSGANKAVYTTALVPCGWAETVMWWAGVVGGAVYTTASVAYNWAGAVMREPLVKLRKTPKKQMVMDQRTDGWMD